MVCLVVQGRGVAVVAVLSAVAHPLVIPGPGPILLTTIIKIIIIITIIIIHIFYLAMGGVAGVPAPLAAVTVRIKAVLGVVTATEEN